MSQIDRIVEVNISRQTQQIDIASFDIPLILSRIDIGTIDFPERVRTYTSLPELGADFSTTHAVYRIASKLLAGDIRPAQFKVGKVQYSTAPNPAQTFTGTANTTQPLVAPVVFTIVAQPTDGTVTLDAATGVYSFVSDVGFDGQVTFDILATDSDTPENTETVTVTISVPDLTIDESYLDALQAVIEDDDTWYALVMESHAETDVKSVAPVMQAQRKMFFTSSQDPAVAMSTSVDDIGAWLNDRDYDRTVLMYSPTADTDYPEASWVGSQLIEIPGSNTWEYKRLPGVAVSKISGTQIAALEEKGVNYYITVKGAPITRRGVSADKSWIDEVIFVDWLHARMQEQIFFRLINKKKVPFTRAGFTLIENEIRQVLSQGVTNGGIADDTPYTVIAPDPLRIPEAQRNARIAADFRFEARLAGAVSIVKIQGVVHA